MPSKFSGKDMVSNLNVLEVAEAALEILQGGGQGTSGYREVMNGVLEYLEQNVKNPIVGSTKASGPSWPRPGPAPCPKTSGRHIWPTWRIMWRPMTAYWTPPRMEPCTQSTPVS
ncbi:MAG: hypothetical protein ACLRNQ_21185 [Flavonifractor plautii]